METKTVKYINVNGKLMDLSHPQVMGILNVTPDSFYAGSRQQTEKDIINRTSQIIEEGASIIDIGAYSSRPNAEHISPEEEMRRLRTGLEIINRYHPGCVVSVDTFRADVARMCVEEWQSSMTLPPEKWTRRCSTWLPGWEYLILLCICKARRKICK